MCACMCVCVCVHVYVCMCTCVCVYVYGVLMLLHCRSSSFYSKSCDFLQRGYCCLSTEPLIKTNYNAFNTASLVRHHIFPIISPVLEGHLPYSTPSSGGGGAIPYSTPPSSILPPRRGGGGGGGGGGGAIPL